MAEGVEATSGKTRDLPISHALRQLLLKAAEAVGIETVRVTSGGQCAKGTCPKRTGSTRHDNGQAADLELFVNGRRQSFTDPKGLPYFQSFVAEAARLGATGLGAGLAYMGAQTVHVGFGSRAVWGAGGKAANAPEWLIEAAKKGWGLPAGLLELDLDSEDEEQETDLEEGPGLSA